MKSQVNVILHVVQGLLKDVQATYPELSVGLRKDLRRVTLTCRNRGLGFFTLDLPHLESLLLQGLESGRLVLEGPVSRRVSKEVGVPRLFSGLWLRIFDRSSCLKRAVDINALFFLRQLLVVAKKLEVGCSDTRIKDAVKEYHNVESRLSRPDLRWSGDELGIRRPDHGAKYRRVWGVRVPTQIALEFFEEEEGKEAACEGEDLKPACNARLKPHELSLIDSAAVNMPTPIEEATCDFDWDQRLDDLRLLEHTQSVADWVIGSLPDIDPVAFGHKEESGLVRFKHGAGAVADRVPRSERSEFRTWSSKLQGTFPYEYCGVSLNYSFGARPLNHEVPSRLICVPKTRKGPRLIASESAPHQWCQQSLLSFFKRCFDFSIMSDFIDLRSQHLSADMVLAASRDRSLATVDMSEASDRLTCWTVERMFRKNPSLLTALHAARTRYLRDDICGDVDFLSLRKFASQGTAVTFPVLSVVCFIISVSACTYGKKGGLPSLLKGMTNQLRIFGDDIIIPSSGYGRVARIMQLLELKVNSSKSYHTGNFRESCGMDGFCGFDITPVKPSTLLVDGPESLTSLIDTSNNLHMKGLWNAAEAVRSLIPKRLLRQIRINGISFSGYPGFTSYSGTDESHLKLRYNVDYQRNEVRSLQFIVCDNKKPRDGRHLLLDFFSSGHDPSSPRTVSTMSDNRRTIFGPRWGPSLVEAGRSIQ